MTNTTLEISLDILSRLTVEEKKKDIVEKAFAFVKKYGMDKLPYHTINTNLKPLPKETERYSNIFEKKLNGIVIIRLWVIKEMLKDLNYKPQ